VFTNRGFTVFYCPEIIIITAAAITSATTATATTSINKTSTNKNEIATYTLEHPYFL
jgi:hypothetical protein